MGHFGFCSFQAETTKTPPSCWTQSTNSLPQTVTPPQQLCPASIQPVPQTAPPSLTMCPRGPQRPAAAEIISPAPPFRPNVSPVSVESSISLQNATPSHSAKEVSSLNLSSAPPPSLPDHDYTSVHPNPTSSLHGSESHLLSLAPKCQLRERNRGRSEEQQRVTSSDTEQCVDGAGTGVNQTGKRVRKPSQKAKALQESAKSKVTLCPSPPCLSPRLSLTHPLVFDSRLKPRRRELLLLLLVRSAPAHLVVRERFRFKRSQ